MKKRLLVCLSLFLAVSGIVSGCGRSKALQKSSHRNVEHTDILKDSDQEDDADWNNNRITPQAEITELEEGQSHTRYEILIQALEERKTMTVESKEGTFPDACIASCLTKSRKGDTV